MEQAIPVIHSVPARPVRLTAGGRTAALLIAAGCLGVLLAAVWLRPSPSGVGTHHAMHIQACQFLVTTGIPCPSCGMTTSFSWFVRGNLLASLYVQPMGAMLALLCGLTFWVALYAGVTGRPAYRMLRFVPGYWWLWVAIVAAGGWGWKIYVHVKGIDGW